MKKSDVLEAAMAINTLEFLAEVGVDRKRHSKDEIKFATTGSPKFTLTNEQTAMVLDVLINNSLATLDRLGVTGID